MSLQDYIKLTGIFIVSGMSLYGVLELAAYALYKAFSLLKIYKS